MSWMTYSLVILKHWLLNTTSYWEPGLALKKHWQIYWLFDN